MKLIDVLIVLSVLLAIVFFLWYVFGQSPTLEQLVMSGVLPCYLFTFGVYKHLSDKINEKFEKINERLSQIGERLAKIEEKINKKG